MKFARRKKQFQKDPRVNLLHMTYVLHMKLPKERRITIGKAGQYIFEPGHYFYIGSARNNLDNRIARHHRKTKKKFWHIDYLLEHTKINTTYTSHLTEDQLVRIFEIVCQVPIKGFGASDSDRCAHLFYSRGAIDQAILPYTVLSKL